MELTQRRPLEADLKPRDYGLDLMDKARGVGRWLWQQRVALVVFLPTLLAMVYYSLIAADQFESESRFVVRSSARPDTGGGLSTLLQIGLGRSQDDAYAVQDFLTSRDATRQLRAALPIERIYGDPSADFLVRYPSILYGSSEEEFYRYFQRVISVSAHTLSGITTLRVRAFRPEDAKSVSLTLLNLGEQLVNRMNARIQRDAIAVSQDELERSQRRLIDAQVAVATFRNRELMIDPIRNAASLAELIGKMSAELAQTRAQITDMLAGSPSSPQLSGLRRRAGALDEQIALERARITSASDGLAERIATYDRLSIERDFANRMMIAAETELARARNEALRQQLYLERIVEPHAADSPALPKRWARVATIFAANLILFFVGWLIFAGVREHGAERG